MTAPFNDDFASSAAHRSRSSSPPQARSSRALAGAAGIVLLFASLGVASCQALFAAEPTSGPADDLAGVQMIFLP